MDCGSLALFPRAMRILIKHRGAQKGEREVRIGGSDGLTGFGNTEVAAGVHEIRSVTSRERLLKTKHSEEQNDVAGETRLHDCSGGYFLKLSWERLPRVGAEHARGLAPSGKNMSANDEMSTRKKNTLAISFGRDGVRARKKFAQQPNKFAEYVATRMYLYIFSLDPSLRKKQHAVRLRTHLAVRIEATTQWKIK